jgi:hypothetical protein
MNKSELLLEILNTKIMEPFRDMGYYFGKFNKYLIFVEKPISNKRNLIFNNRADKIKYLYSLISDNVENNKYNWKLPNPIELDYITQITMDDHPYRSTIITTANYTVIDTLQNYKIFPILKIYIG